MSRPCAAGLDALVGGALLEELIDRAKPPDLTAGSFHYLLSTPFRYPPLRRGSRFGSRRERGIWYGSEQRRTILAEVAYHRLIFLQGSRADLGVVVTRLSLLTIRAHARHGIDLASKPFDSHRRTISSPSRYSATQALGGLPQAGKLLLRPAGLSRRRLAPFPAI
ncbi:MAG TPA: RES domain-containing protein [Gemmatimonadaceae bacterium]|nr:RES domain-containing protein [Gemmatimonadaceae bacterium]